MEKRKSDRGNGRTPIMMVAIERFENRGDTAFNNRSYI